MRSQRREQAMSREGCSARESGARSIRVSCRDMRMAGRGRGIMAKRGRTEGRRRRKSEWREESGRSDCVCVDAGASVQGGGTEDAATSHVRLCTCEVVDIGGGEGGAARRSQGANGKEAGAKGGEKCGVVLRAGEALSGRSTSLTVQVSGVYRHLVPESAGSLYGLHDPADGHLGVHAGAPGAGAETAHG
eukprot:1209002-Rhodomonas_salina.3